MSDPLNRTTAKHALRFFDVCFKRGVLDACEYGDDFGAREFVEKHSRAWDFGVLGEPDDFDWRMWRFILYRWARQANGLGKFAESYIYQVTKKNYLWYLLPYCMRFYMMGIKEWMDYPNRSGIERFKMTTAVHWNPEASKIRRMSRSDYIWQMQEFAYQFRRATEATEYLSQEAMDDYCKAIHKLTKSYA
jgi:hypothetical protein